jgi:hypothetical protein
MSIPGVVYSQSTPQEEPHFLVIAREKAGKSTLATTLFDWPNKGDEPLVIAIDPTGVDSAAQLGRPLAHLKLRDEPGNLHSAKLKSILKKLEPFFGFDPRDIGLPPQDRRKRRPRTASGKGFYTSLIIDDASTLADRIFDDSEQHSSNPNKLAHYGDVLDACRSFFWRVKDLQVPVVWLAWLREAEKDSKGKLTLGGPAITGTFREKLSGWVHNVLWLEKVPGGIGSNDPGLCSDGMIRRLWSKPHAAVNCDGRYALPSPMPANLAWAMHYVKTGWRPEQQQAANT